MLTDDSVGLISFFLAYSDSNGSKGIIVVIARCKRKAKSNPSYISVRPTPSKPMLSDIKDKGPEEGCVYGEHLETLTTCS